MKNFITLSLLLCHALMVAQIKMPQLFADDMVLQRNKNIPVWGWAKANEKVTVKLNKQAKTTTADKDGKWTLDLAPEKAGGPYNLVISGTNTVTLKNVLVGEVWICSGQSNMEFQMYKNKDATIEMADSNYPQIRQFLVAQDMSGQPKTDLKNGKWSIANPENIRDFTAVGFFFAKKLFAELQVPIGIINTSWGGTCVETWTSKEAFQTSPEFKDMINQLTEVNIDQVFQTYKNGVLSNLKKVQGFEVSMDREELFSTYALDDSNWPEIKVPSLWENQQIGNIDGVVWMRKTILLTADDIKKGAVLQLAKIDDQDVTYVNGIQVGATDNYEAERKYTIPAGVLKVGKNVIAVRIADYSGGGGIYGESTDVKFQLEEKTIPLDGLWKFNVVQVRIEISPNNYPSLLYNAMINPLIPYAFQGVLWYQGEANVTRAEQYKKAFPLMINDWRTKWKQGNFPFYFVQLSTFDEFKGNSKIGSPWAELREAQLQTLSLANTGMAVTTDIGNAKDIHPTNKKDVGTRLAAIALNKVYQKNNVFSGPIFNEQKIIGNQISIAFTKESGTLSTANGQKEVIGFEIAGEDQNFYPAKATIINNAVVVTSEFVKVPVAVRYGWADDDTNINLFNTSNFPASPFRTDSWELSTVKNKYQVSK